MAPENKRKRPADAGKPTTKPTATKSAPTADAASNKRPKTTTVQADTPAPPSTLSKKEETSFPRGGQQALTPLEYKEVTNEAAHDVLFEASGGAAVGGEEIGILKRSKHKKVNKKKDGKKNAGADDKKDDGPKVEGFSYKRLIPGTLVLGCVQKINKTDIALSLPNNLTGYIPITQISDKLNARIEALAKDAEKSDAEEDEEEDDDDEEEDDLDLSALFRVGQYLRAHVLHASEEGKTEKAKKVKAKKRIELSLLPNTANSGLALSDLQAGVTVQASVVSVEDHGLVMDLGLEGDIKGFLSSKELGPGLTIATAKEGQTILTTVTGMSSNGKIVKLSADLEQKFSKKGKLAGGKAAWWLTNAPTIDAFLPGTGVEVLVTDVGKQGGIVGTIMGSLDAVADYFHVAGWDKDLATRVQVGNKIKARITSTFPSSDPRKVGFSILPHLLSFGPAMETDPLTALPVGTIIDTAKVLGVESRVGLFVDVGVEGVPGFVHISRVSSEGKLEDLPKDIGEWKVGTVHQARILGFNPMDGLYMASTEKRVIEQPFLRIDDIKVGQVVKGTVQTILDRGGLVISVSDGITGLVEEEHISDVKLKNPEKKFREGSEVKVRVLSTNPARRKLYLTLKKTIVNSDAPIIDSYEVEAGTQSVGTLVKVLDTGAVVKFYSGVSAWLPVSEMSEAYIQNPKEHFRVGQSVNVNVLATDPENRKMRVSCKDPSTFGAEQKEALHVLKVGQVISGKVSEKTDDELVLELEGVGAEGLKGVLVLGHLTDGSREKNMSAMKKLRAGQTLTDLVVLDKNENRRMIYLTMKPSLVKASKAGTVIDSFDKITEGAVVKGFVKNTADVGAFISFLGGVTGLALRNALPAAVQSLPNFGYYRLQSVTATVFAVNREEQKFLLSLRPADEVSKKEKSSVPVDAKDAVNPVDGASTSVDDYVPGKLTKAKIVSVQGTQINVQLADNIQGRIDVSQLYDSYDDIKNKKIPLEGWKKGTVLDVRVIGIHDARNHRFLAITHRTSNKKAPIFELSARPKDVKDEAYEVLSMDKVTVGSSHLAFVNNITPDCLWVNISPEIRGRIRILDLTEDVAQLKDIERHFPVGSALKVNVVNVDAAHGKLDLSGRRTSVSKLDLDTLTKGMVVPGRIVKVLERQLLVSLSDNVAGIVNLTDLSDDFSQAKISNYEKNQVVRVCVLDVDKTNKRVTLSMRPSRVMSSSLPIKDAEVTSVHEIKERELRRGFVKNVSDKGLFVTLGSNVTAWVKVSDLSDGFVKEWKSKYQVDQVVEGRIINVDAPLGHVQMSLRPSAVTGKAERQTGLSDFTKGQIVTGKVTKVAEYGVFVRIDGSNVSGLCHKSQIADRKVEDISKLYVEGDPVKAIILEIDLEKRRISFGLKASYFADKPEDKSDSEDGGMDLDAEDVSDEEGGVDLSNVRDMSSDSEEDSDAEDSDVDMDDAPVASTSGGLSAGGFDFTGASLFEKRPAADADSDSETEAANKKRTKKRKTTIQADMTGEMISREPQSATDFERLLLGDPNDSRLWIQYMAFQLQLSELDKAREIAERALKTISQREDAEKKNIWIALLNMENSYGDDESLDETFKRATQYMDSKDIHDRLVSIFIQSGKTEKADALFKTMLKKFSQHPTVWLNYADFLLSNVQNRMAARELLKRALQALPQDSHRDLIIKFASLEFRTGDPERGRTLFENLIGAYAKRMDLWNVFIDMEVKYGEKENVREAFRRALKEEKCKPKQASALCRKWKEWEEKEGDAKGVKEVAERARAFVEAAKARK